MKKSSEIKELKKEKVRTIGRMIVIGFVATVVIVVLTIAWFANNTKVHSTDTAVSADMRNVELKTSGGAGIHDDLLKKITESEQVPPQKSFWYEFGDKIETSPEKYAINWLLSNESNIGNYSTTQSDWEKYWKNPPQGAERQDEAIEPGDSGELTFYVVPKYGGTVELSMNLSLIPYKVKDTEITEINDSVAKNFIDGHILFFLENKTETGEKTIQWIKDGTFRITIEDAKKDDEYGYTLYWCWPQSFGEAVLKAGDIYLNNRNTLFSEFQNDEKMRKLILQGDDLSMVKKPERYFFSNLIKAPLSSDSNQKELEEIPKMYNQSSEKLSADAKNAFVDLSSYYNQADQYIGSHVDCVRIQLSAE